MSEASRYIPASLKRSLLEECGYRCAVPTCRGTSALQFEHIEDWAKLDVKEHDFDKMIVLCANCHARVTSKEIHKNAVRTYKRNLAIMNGRYSLFEVRLLEKIHKSLPILTTEHAIHYATESDLLHCGGLLRDGYVTKHKLGQILTHAFKEFKLLGEHASELSLEQQEDLLGKMLNQPKYTLCPTEDGFKFVERYFGGKEIE